jgi:hypothetical protein
MRLSGVISFYDPNPKNPFGFIAEKIPSGAGFIINKYFFHASRIIQSEIDETDIQKGCPVTFELSDRPPKPGRDRAAVKIHIFAKPVPVTAGIDDALAGKVSS